MTITRTLKRGYVRKDGKVFWQYRSSTSNLQTWVTPERFKEAQKNNVILARKWRAENPERQQTNARRWYSRNPERVLINSLTKRAKNRKDPLKRLIHTIRGTAFSAFYLNGFQKTSNTAKIIGCSFEFLKQYIEQRFFEGMTWENMGSDWHIDHYIPVSSASTKQQVIKLNHYTNLRPLWKAQNLSKGSKQPAEQLSLITA